jgi:hypothetical protein
MSQVSKAQAVKEFWYRGNLYWKLHSVQKEMYKVFYGSEKNSTLVWLLSRQSGKSVLLSVLAIEQSIKKKNSVVKILTDTKIHAKNIFEPIFKMILEDCPEELKPRYSEKDYAYNFPNGSVIQLAGSDNGHYERLRGQKSELILVDEAGFCDNLDYVISSVLFPTTTHTGGRIVLASTPSPDPDHDFLRFMEKAELEGLLTKKTIFDNPLLSKEQVDRIIKEMGGVNSTKFRREYTCELIKDDVLAIVPEFDEVAEKELVKEWERPPFFDSYVSMDLGGRDLTALLFGYYDFLKDKVVIEDELIMDFNKSENTIKSLTEQLLQKEISLYTDPQTGETKAPYQRVSDINYIVTQEISRYSNNTVHFINPRKDDKDAAINQLRALITTKKIIIHPRCKTLIRHLKNAKWNKSKTSFARSPDNGHYDCVDALIYLIRSISYTKNPYPNNYNIDTRNLFQTNKPSSNPYQTSQLSSAVEVFKKAFKVK